MHGHAQVRNGHAQVRTCSRSPRCTSPRSPAHPRIESSDRGRRPWGAVLHAAAAATVLPHCKPWRRGEGGGCSRKLLHGYKSSIRSRCQKDHARRTVAIRKALWTSVAVRRAHCQAGIGGMAPIPEIRKLRLLSAERGLRGRRRGTHVRDAYTQDLANAIGGDSDSKAVPACGKSSFECVREGP